MVSREGPLIGIRVVSTDVAFVPDFLNAANNFLRLVTEVDIATSSHSSRTADWVLRELSYSSPAQLVMEPVAIEGQDDNRALVIDTTIRGIDALKMSDSRPRHFSDQALKSASSLVTLQGERIDRIELFSNEASIECDESIAANIRTILRPGREVLGSVTGMLEAMNSHSAFQFAIYEPVLGIRIVCRVAPDAPENLHEKIVGLYEHRVRVSGLLRTNVKGEVRSARVDSIEELPSVQRFTKASEIAGLYDITAGQDAEEYIRNMRDA